MRYLIIPLTVNEDGVSPGCTRAVINTTSLFSNFNALFSICLNGNNKSLIYWSYYYIIYVLSDIVIKCIFNLFMLAISVSTWQ